MSWRTLVIEYLSQKQLVKISSPCFLQILSQIWVNVTTLKSGRLGYFFDKQETKHKSIRYLLTYSMEQSPSWEADQSSQLTKKFPAFYGTRRFFTVLTSASHPSLSLKSMSCSWKFCHQTGMWNTFVTNKKHWDQMVLDIGLCKRMYLCYGTWNLITRLNCWCNIHKRLGPEIIR
jgi:hypothetical protein